MSTPAPSSPQPCIVLRFNHFDPLWRRCWDRRFSDGTRQFASYREIEAAWLDDAIASAADGNSCFAVEASWVLRHYLERRPEQVAAVRALAQQGRCEVLASGENIIDTNMVHGELLVRNLVLGLRWAEATLGVRPSVGWMSDDFGSSAQVPQVFRGCGIRWLPALSYNTPNAPYWRGLDGSTVFFEVKGKLAHRLGCGATTYRKHPPCAACRGLGCAACHGRGFDSGPRAELTTPPTAAVPGAAAVVVLLWGEEILPGLEVAAAVRAANAQQQELVLRQGLYRDLQPFIQAELDQVDDPPAALVSTKVENNPSQSGCYVTRIKIKQGHRAAEQALLAAEMLDTILHAGAAAESLRACWRDLTLGAFHDSITSSHVDPAYDELLDLFAGVTLRARQAAHAAVAGFLTPVVHTVSVFNAQSAAVAAPVSVPLPAGWAGATVCDAAGQSVPVYEVASPADAGSAPTLSFLAAPPPLGCASYTLAPATPARTVLAERSVTLDAWTLAVGEQGLTGITHRDLGPVARAGGFLVGELVLESDVGDPWATRSLDRTRWRLAPHTRLQSVVRAGDSVAVTYTGRHPSSDDPHFCADPQVTLLEWTQVFRLRRGLPWIEVSTSVKWYTHSRRLRLMVPSTTTLNDGVYDIPFGTLSRPRYEGQTNHGGSAGGDWPALHWAGIAAPGHTLAVFNAGTPSYRVEDGVVAVSVLRSPQLPYGLHEPQWYAVQNYHGMMDHGEHHFRHALYAAAGTWAENDIGRQAAAFNASFPVFAGRVDMGAVPRWSLAATHAAIAAVKPAEDGHGVVLRVHETAGRAERVTLRLPPAFTRAQRCNLLEEPQADLPPSPDAGFVLELAPWAIATVRCTGTAG